MSENDNDKFEWQCKDISIPVDIKLGNKDLDYIFDCVFLVLESLNGGAGKIPNIITKKYLQAVLIDYCKRENEALFSIKINGVHKAYAIFKYESSGVGFRENYKKLLESYYKSMETKNE